MCHMQVKVHACAHTHTLLMPGISFMIWAPPMLFIVLYWARKSLKSNLFASKRFMLASASSAWSTKRQNTIDSLIPNDTSRVATTANWVGVGADHSEHWIFWGRQMEGCQANLDSSIWPPCILSLDPYLNCLFSLFIQWQDISLP